MALLELVFGSGVERELDEAAVRECELAEEHEVFVERWIE